MQNGDFVSFLTAATATESTAHSSICTSVLYTRQIRRLMLLCVTKAKEIHSFIKKIHSLKHSFIKKFHSLKHFIHCHSLPLIAIHCHTYIHTHMQPTEDAAGCLVSSTFGPLYYHSFAFIFDSQKATGTASRAPQDTHARKISYACVHECVTYGQKSA